MSEKRRGISNEEPIFRYITDNLSKEEIAGLKEKQKIVNEETFQKIAGYFKTHQKEMVSQLPPMSTKPYIHFYDNDTYHDEYDEIELIGRKVRAKLRKGYRNVAAYREAKVIHKKYMQLIRWHYGTHFIDAVIAERYDDPDAYPDIFIPKKPKITKKDARELHEKYRGRPLPTKEEEVVELTEDEFSLALKESIESLKETDDFYTDDKIHSSNAMKRLSKKKRKKLDKDIEIGFIEEMYKAGAPSHELTDVNRDFRSVIDKIDNGSGRTLQETFRKHERDLRYLRDVQDVDLDYENLDKKERKRMKKHQRKARESMKKSLPKTMEGLMRKIRKKLFNGNEFINLPLGKFLKNPEYIDIYFQNELGEEIPYEEQTVLYEGLKKKRSEVDQDVLLKTLTSIGWPMELAFKMAYGRSSKFERTKGKSSKNPEYWKQHKLVNINFDDDEEEEFDNGGTSESDLADNLAKLNHMASFPGVLFTETPDGNVEMMVNEDLQEILEEGSLLNMSYDELQHMFAMSSPMTPTQTKRKGK